MRLQNVIIPLILIVISTKGCESLSCHRNLTIVDKGILLPTGDLQAEEYTFSPNNFERINSTHYRICICSAAKCLRKCCPVGTAYVGRRCTPTNLPLNFKVYDRQLQLMPDNYINTFRLINGETCALGKYAVGDEGDETRYLLLSGMLYMPNNINLTQLTTEQFCVDNQILNENTTAEFVLACFPELLQVDDSGQLYPVGMIISIPFLLATFIVYCCIPELRNLHGKNLMCQVSTLSVGYIFLVIITLGGKDIEAILCRVAGFFVQFSFLSTFFWLNVMSFDIWWAFSGFKGFKGSIVEREHKTFVVYSLYAWGSSLILLTVALVLDLSPNIPDYIIKPEIGKKTCWMKSQEALLAYFYGPVACILISNLVFFSLTAYKIIMVKRDTKVLDGSESRKNSEANKQRYFLYLKLFLIMGVNWMMEVLSWAVGGPDAVWYLTDVCNTLQGFFIFVIFVWKPRTKKLILAKLGIKPAHVESEGTTFSTASSRISRNSTMAMPTITSQVKN